MLKTTLECPCCGNDGADSDEMGMYYDQQELICGCVGHVVVDEDDVWINTSECPCMEDE